MKKRNPQHTLYLDQKVITRLREAAKRHRRTQSAIVEEALTLWYELGGPDATSKLASLKKELDLAVALAGMTDEQKRAAAEHAQKKMREREKSFLPGLTELIRR